MGKGNKLRIGIGILNPLVFGSILVLGIITEAPVLISWAYGRISRPPRVPLSNG